MTLLKKQSHFKGFGSSNKSSLDKTFIIKANRFRSETNEDFDLNQLTKNAAQIELQDSSSVARISKEELNEIIKWISKEKKCTKEEAFAALALLAQFGATSARTQGGFHVKYNDTEFKIETIRPIIKSVTKKNLRRLAKTFATNFHVVAKGRKIAGNLYNKIKTTYPDFVLKEEEDKFWMSDFQSENEDCPEYIWEILIKYYNEKIKKD